MKSISTYKDFKLFLRDYYLNEKKSPRGFTHAQFAKLAGLKSPNYLKLVIDGQRPLTTASIQAFAKAMNLTNFELDYFEGLVLENQSVSAIEKRYYVRRLSRLRKNSIERIERKKPTELLDGPLRIATLLCASKRTMADAVAAACEELLIPSHQAKQIIEGLIKQNELRISEDGILRRPARHQILSDPKALHELQRRFLQEGLEEAKTVFQARYQNGTAKFLSLLVSANEGSLNDLFDDLRSEVESVVDLHDPKPQKKIGVYRVQLQAYRLIKSKS